MNKGIKARTASPKRRFVLLTNIPTPYRLWFFEALAGEVARRGWAFEVWFMAKTEPGRFWKFKKQDFRFPHRFFRGVSPAVRRIAFHLNPGVLARLWFNPPDVLMLGQWMLPTTFFGMPAARWLGRSRIIFWLESHGKSSLLQNSPVKFIRHVFYSHCDAFATPGRFATELVNLKAPGKPVYSLPNVVDENFFSGVAALRAHKGSLRAELRIPSDNRVFLIPARLVGEKGLQEFLETLFSIPVETLRRLTVVIAGEGPLRLPLEKSISLHPGFDVRLPGNMPAGEMLKLYAACDALALPSLIDANPLSVIEACWAGLPLLLSDRVGNHPETLHQGENGWLFSIADPGSLVRAVREFLLVPDADLAKMGGVSRQIAEKNFSTGTVVRQFLDQAGL